MLRLVLKDTSFQFNGKHNLQMRIHGTAMGTKTALSFANIYMAKIETESLSKPTAWKRYIYDMFSLRDNYKPDIETFIEQTKFSSPYYKTHGQNL